MPSAPLSTSAGFLRRWWNTSARRDLWIILLIALGVWLWPVLSDGGYGAVRMLVRLPGYSSGAPEPMVVIGKPGEANLGYVRVLPEGRFKVGAEFWGVGAYESEELSAPTGQPVEIVFSFPAFFPPPGSFRSKGVLRTVQEARRQRLQIKVDGRLVLEREVNAPLPGRLDIYYGRNPVGGSLVYPVFTGEVLQATRLPLAEP
jgi:hypothetical protein